MVDQRLPIVDSDDGIWGDILRQYLMKEHYNDDTNNTVNGGHKTITIRAGTASANSAPLKFTSGTLLSTPEAGAIEFLTDTLYFTDTSGPTRKVVATYPVSGGAEGDIYYRNSGGAFTRLAIGGADDLLSVSSGVPAWTTSLSGISIDAANNTVTNLDVADFAASAIVTEGEGISSNDNDSTLPTSAAVKDYVDNNAGGLTWVEVTGTSQSAADNSGYITNNAGLVTVTIPTTAAVGDTVRIVGKGAGGWRIAQNASETIHFGNLSTTTGTGGRLDSTNRYDSVELVCITANTDWAVASSIGNIGVT